MSLHQSHTILCYNGALQSLDHHSIRAPRASSARRTDFCDALSAYLEQIDLHNSSLKAVIATPPRDRLIELAKLLDDERHQGNTRRPPHGIPVLNKVGGANSLCTPYH
jgi:Asp-tRNA(Asn)/Glu-tRNA(Gln) amidotransferase A subunit family amidase